MNVKVAAGPHQDEGAVSEPRGHRSKARRALPTRSRAGIAAAAALCSVIAVAGCSGTSSSGSAASPPTTRASGAAGTGTPSTHAGGGAGSTGGSNARSGPAAGGSAGTVGGVSGSAFTLTTSAGQKVTVDETSSTTYEKGSAPASAGAVSTDEPVLVLGTADGTTITATQVVVESTAVGSRSSTAGQVVPFQRGARSTSKQSGQIPADYTEGSGTIVSGTTADKATRAALAAYPGGVVDRVVKLGNGEYEVHIIGVNWPHHIFVGQDFKVAGAN